jgi:hypothetical protein
MQGLIIFYLNFPTPEQLDNPQPLIDLTRRINQEVFDKVQKEADYQVVIVPCQKESCRFEKIDFDKPFPRYSTRTHADKANDDESEGE